MKELIYKRLSLINTLLRKKQNDEKYPFLSQLKKNKVPYTLCSI